MGMTRSPPIPTPSGHVNCPGGQRWAGVLALSIGIALVADPGGGGAMSPQACKKIVIKKMDTECGGLYFMFLGSPLSEVSGSATEHNLNKLRCANKSDLMITVKLCE